MKTASSGLTLIKNFEGLRLTAYLCPAQVWTIGFGSTGAHVKPGMTITKEQAEDLLLKDLVRFENAVHRLVKVPLTQNQFDALVSFTFNVGIGSLQKSTLLRLLNEGKYDQVGPQLMRWNKAGGKELPGLTRRRRAEADLFNKKD